LPVIKVPLLESEVVGLKKLREVGEYLYGGNDPARVFLRDNQLALITTMASTL